MLKYSKNETYVFRHIYKNMSLNERRLIQAERRRELVRFQTFQSFGTRSKARFFTVR